MNIEIIDSVMCKCDSPNLIKNSLLAQREFWKKDNFGHRQRNEYEVSLVAKDGTFLTGFLPRVIKFCEKNKLPFKIEGEIKKLPYKSDIDPPGITLFEDQKKLVEIILKEQRGVLQAPTGTGKTILCYAIINAFESRKSLIICPSKSIMNQTAIEFSEKFGMKTSMVGDGNKDLSGDVVVAIVNSLSTMPEENYHDIFDVVIVDEAHHASSFSGMFYDALTNILAPVKIGVTATACEEGTEKAMACEGLIGPVAGTFSIAEATEAKRLAKPKLVLLSIPKNTNIRDMRIYGDSIDKDTKQVTHGIYTMGIVRNRMRNNIIANFIKEQALLGKTSMVFTKILEHADILYEMLTEKGVNAEIVNGAVAGDLREDLRTKLNNKEIQCIVATAAWKEGINIPSLSIVVNAAGYLAPTPVIQMAGRGLRTFEGKEEAIVVDCLDIGRHLSNHCVERLQTYKELGWL